MKVVDYQICMAHSVRKLENFVKIHIEGGYKPIGGIAIEKTDGKDFYYQAIIKEK